VLQKNAYAFFCNTFVFLRFQAFLKADFDSLGNLRNTKTQMLIFKKIIGKKFAIKKTYSKKQPRSREAVFEKWILSVIHENP